MLVIKIITNILWAFRSFVICCPHQQLIELGEEKNFTDLRHFLFLFWASGRYEYATRRRPVFKINEQVDHGLLLEAGGGEGLCRTDNYRSKSCS